MLSVSRRFCHCRVQAKTYCLVVLAVRHALTLIENRHVPRCVLITISHELDCCASINVIFDELLIIW